MKKFSGRISEVFPLQLNTRWCYCMKMKKKTGWQIRLRSVARVITKIVIEKNVFSKLSTTTPPHPTTYPHPPPPPSRMKWPPCRDDISKYNFGNEIFVFKCPFRLIPRGRVDNTIVLVQVMAWRRTEDKPLPESLLIQFTDAFMRQ